MIDELKVVRKPDSKFLCIKVPAKVDNPSQAIERMGGLLQIYEKVLGYNN